jgi:amidase
MNNKQNDVLSISRRKAIGLLGVGGLAIQLPFGCSFEQSKIDSGTNEPLYYRTIAEISKMIKSKEISSVELTQQILNRIEKVDEKLNSFITVMKQSALSRALELDKELESGKYRGPLHGIPIAIKDLLYTTNAPTTGGHAFNIDFIPSYNATVINRLHDSGAVIVGKLNLAEGAMGGYHPLFKIPKNPWGEFWTGVSSSGSGVATAAGLCFASIGTDTGGSIRFPSLSNGIVGLKPSFGLVSRYGVMPLSKSMDHVGPMTRSTEDAATMLEAIAGYDPNDPTTFQVEVPKISISLKKGIKGIRIGFDIDYVKEGVEPSMVSSIELAIEKMTELGAEIVPITMPGKKDEYGQAWFTICSKEAINAHSATYRKKRDDYGSFFQGFLDHGTSVTEEQYNSALKYKEEYKNAFRKLFSDVDAIIAPAGGISNVPDEEMMRGPMSGYDEYTDKFDHHFGTPADFAGTPSLTLPCGMAENRPPNGFQLMADYLKEDILCRIGYAYEQGTKWHEQHPNV